MILEMQKDKQKKSLNKIRIIGGKWRGRMLNFPDIPGLRPTPNRVRETLFNWLSPYIHGARCLDLFAGSGALGFEALSRGAREATLVDHHPRIIAALKENQALLNAEEITIVSLEIPSLFKAAPFNIVFLDPPFGENFIQPCSEWLESENLLTDNALVYIEAEKTLKPLPTPSNWELLKSKTAGQVGYHLFIVNKPKI